MSNAERKQAIAAAVVQVELDIKDMERRKKTAMEGYRVTLKDLRKQLDDLLHESETGQKRIEEES